MVANKHFSGNLSKWNYITNSLSLKVYIYLGSESLAFCTMDQKSRCILTGAYSTWHWLKWSVTTGMWLWNNIFEILLWNNIIFCEFCSRYIFVLGNKPVNTHNTSMPYSPLKDVGSPRGNIKRCKSWNHFCTARIQFFNKVVCITWNMVETCTSRCLLEKRMGRRWYEESAWRHSLSLSLFPSHGWASHWTPTFCVSEFSM